MSWFAARCRKPPMTLQRTKCQWIRRQERAHGERKTRLVTSWATLLPSCTARMIRSRPFRTGWLTSHRIARYKREQDHAKTTEAGSGQAAPETRSEVTISFGSRVIAVVVRVCTQPARVDRCVGSYHDHRRFGSLAGTAAIVLGYASSLHHSYGHRRNG